MNCRQIAIVMFAMVGIVYFILGFAAVSFYVLFPEPFALSHLVAGGTPILCALLILTNSRRVVRWVIPRGVGESTEAVAIAGIGIACVGLWRTLDVILLVSIGSVPLTMASEVGEDVFGLVVMLACDAIAGLALLVWGCPLAAVCLGRGQLRTSLDLPSEFGESRESSFAVFFVLLIAVLGLLLGLVLSRV